MTYSLPGTEFVCLCFERYESIKIETVYRKNWGLEKKMNSSAKAVCFSLVVLIGLLLVYEGGTYEESQSFLSANRFILIVDLGALNCPLCVQSLTEFIGTANAFKLEKDVLGVLVLGREENDSISETKIKIAEKKLRGFIKGNNVQFPFFLDRIGVFNLLKPDATAVLILFDSEESEIRKYTFPLTSAQIQEMIRD